MHTYEVHMETRQQGAIGEFGITVYKVEAASLYDATAGARKLAERDGLEVRVPRKVVRK